MEKLSINAKGTVIHATPMRAGHVAYSLHDALEYVHVFSNGDE